MEKKGAKNLVRVRLSGFLEKDWGLICMTLKEKREKEYQELQERKEKEHLELEQQLKEALSLESIEFLSLKEDVENWNCSIKLAFVLDGYRQEDDFYWSADESQGAFIQHVKNRINYIKELRAQYPEFCKQNDYIQSNSNFHKKISLTHMGYNREFYFEIQLADYLKLPNQTRCGIGGGDYEIKRTPKRVEEYNKNIDITIDVLLDCISELKQMKCKT
jgi:hypothetical protein